MWYVCDVLYAVLYVRVSCFVVCGCAFVVVVRLRSWFVSVYVSRLEVAEFPDGVHWFVP